MRLIKDSTTAYCNSRRGSENVMNKVEPSLTLKTIPKLGRVQQAINKHPKFIENLIRNKKVIPISQKPIDRINLILDK